MGIVCPICSSSPPIRGALDGDVVRKLTLKQLSHKYGLPSRVVLRHIKHLPELLETEAAASKPSTVFIGAVNYDVNIFVSPPAGEEVVDEEVEGDAVAVDRA